jgi:hypothetical protein
MHKKINLMGILLWSLVLITVAFSYEGVNTLESEKIRDLCGKFKNDPQSMPSSKLDHLLSGLNELRFIHEEKKLPTSLSHLQWIDACTGLIMVEVKSRIFEKKLQKSPK